MYVRLLARDDHGDTEMMGMEAKKIVLAYSGGLDTSVLLRYLHEKYDAEIIAVTGDVGQGRDLDEVRERALKVGAIEAHTLDLKDEFAENYVLPALKANALYEGVYPLASALSRPLIAGKLVKLAKEKGAFGVAHGCTGKGNDQVRFDVSITALDSGIEPLAPIRNWGLSRDEEVDYAAKHGIPVPVKKSAAYSIDDNLWGRSIECGPLEDPWAEPPEDAFKWTVSASAAPDQPLYVTIGWERGKPVSLDGQEMSLVALIEEVNKLAGQHGVGRIDHIENRLVGIKSREVYECPAATVLIETHRDLENLVLPREVAGFKPLVESKWAQIVYEGLWYSPLRGALDAFVEKTQERVTGATKVKLFKGKAMVVGRKSPWSMYDYGLATYDKHDLFDHAASEGFISLFGLPTKVWHEAGRKHQADRKH
jgi:argininosuccinate synthase